MSTPTGNKKRRIEAASNALSKPFRSPFKSVAAAKSSADTPGKAAHVDHSGQQAQEDSPRSARVVSVSTPLHNFRRSAPSPGSSVSVPNTDPDIRPILKKQRELEAKLREWKEDVDTIQQARKIEKDSKSVDDGKGEVDGELKVLTVKWRQASRIAADELFGIVKDRVNRSGGPRAWKEAQDRQKEFQCGFDEEPPKNDEVNGGDEQVDQERLDLLADYAAEQEAETQHEKDARGVQGDGLDEIDGDEFTMPMMLKSINVDLALIGYDRDYQKWSD